MARPGVGGGGGGVSRCKADPALPADLEKVRVATSSTHTPKLGRLSFLSPELGVKPKHGLTKHRKGFSESIPLT